ncbi:pilus assembly/adherence protein PilC [Neisseria meningitidis]|nr:pilus assembly/adherence protein PilC [Neisseria meningitidis]
MNAQNLPEVKWGNAYSSLAHKSNEREVTHTSYFVGPKKNVSFSFRNTDEVVAQKNGTIVFGAATYLPPYGKVSSFDTAKLTERKNAVDQINTTHPGLIGYNYQDVTCSSGNCPELSYRTQFTFNNGLKRNGNGGRLDIYEDKSRDSSPIYKLKDHPWLGVSFNLGGESSFKPKRQGSLVSSFSEDVTQQNGTQDQYKSKNLVYTTDDYNSKGNKNHQDRHHAVAFYLNAKLHLLDKKQIKNIAQGVTVDLGTLKTRIEPTQEWKNRGGNYFNNGTWTYEEKGSVSVKLKLPEVKAGRCINKPNPNPNAKALSPALTAPALWFGAGQDGKAEMYSASVSTYPDSSSSRIFLQNLKRKNDPNKPGRYSLADLSASDIQSKEPTFTSRQTIIRLDGGVQQIKLDKSNEATGLNGNDGKNDTFGIVSEGSFTLDVNEWKKVLLPWTVRGSADDGRFKSINQESSKYSQRYRIRENGNNSKRDLGDIVNSPIVAVGGYLATSANDGMVHIFKKGNGVDERNYSLKLSYIPGTMPRQYFDNDTSALKDSTLAKELRAFAEKSYVGDRYGVDGGFVLRQVERNGKDHVFMFGAMGFGGRGAYALDLTKADGNDPKNASLFDVKNGDNIAELGYTVGTPQIGKTHNGKYAAFLASGYATKDINNGDNKTALYVYDLESNNGTPIAKIEVPNGKGGLSSPTLVDKDLDGTVDIAYAGDRGGSMYRFDLSSQDPQQWSVRTIFSGNKPITSAPAISQLKDKRVVIFGTGSDLSEDDVDNTDEQYIYGIFDDDTATTGSVNFSGSGGGLLEQVLSRDNDNKTLFLTDYKRSDGSGSKGWVVNLQPGQRVTVKPTVVLRTAFVTIRKYNDGGCGAETAILGINTADGGKLTKKSARPIVPADNTAVAQYSGHKQTAKGKSIPIGCMEKNNGIVCPNGYVYDKPVNVRYLDEKKTDGFSTTADGDAGGSGTFKEGKKPARNNRCFSGKGVRTLLMNDLDSLDITGPTCGMKRISWREVFY